MVLAGAQIVHAPYSSPAVLVLFVPTRKYPETSWLVEEAFARIRFPVNVGETDKTNEPQVPVSREPSAAISAQVSRLVVSSLSVLRFEKLVLITAREAESASPAAMVVMVAPVGMSVFTSR